MTTVIAPLECTSAQHKDISLKNSSSKMIKTTQVDLGTSGSIKAKGPCFNSPAEKASAWIQVNSFNFKAPSLAMNPQGPFPKQMIVFYLDMNLAAAKQLSWILAKVDPTLTGNNYKPYLYNFLFKDEVPN